MASAQPAPEAGRGERSIARSDPASAADGGAVPARRGRGRPKASSDEAKRAVITKAARELFAELGFGATTMTDVTARSGVSRRTVYRLFPGKLALFRAVVESLQRSMVALPGSYAGLSLAEALERIFVLDISPEADAERVALLRVAMMERHLFPQLSEIVRSHGRDCALSLLTQWLADERDAGRAAFPDAGVTANLLMDLAFQPLVARLRGEDYVLPGALDQRQYLAACIRVVAEGMVPR